MSRTKHYSPNFSTSPWLNCFVLALLTALISLTALAAYHRFQLGGLGIDDSDIFFVYARNFANGHGFVYNIGGERVEGFTSILWTLIVSAGFIFFSDPRIPLAVINVALLCSTLFLSIRMISDRLNADGIGSGRMDSAGIVLLLAWCLASPDFLVWQIHSLMETGLWTFSLTLCVFGCFQLAQRFSRRYCYLLCLGLILTNLTRPEGIAFSILFLALYLLSFLTQRNIDRTHTKLGKATPLIVTIITLFTIYVVRHNYFGEWFPNTYYAKVGPGRIYNLVHGFHYILEFLIEKPILCIPIMSALMLFVGRVIDSIRTSKLEITALQDILITSTCLVSLGIPLLVGGDHFPGFRFQQPFWQLYLIPPLILFREYLLPPLQKFSTCARLAIKMSILLTLIFCMIVSHRTSWLQPADLGTLHDFQLAQQQRNFGESLNTLFKGANKPSVGVSAAGGFKYSYEGNVIDLMGLNDRTIAHLPGNRQGVKDHAAFNISQFYKILPDFFEPSTCSRIDESHVFKSTKFEMNIYKNLFSEQHFKEKYTYIKLTTDKNSTPICLFARKDFIEYLTARRPFALQEVPNVS
jgi:hypothetical protein